MKIVGFITEYNPFHFGHKYHLEKSKSLTNSTYSIAIMSSSFVQRGEPAFLDKWTRAKMAIENGVDLVIELPFIYSSQSAELFALGGVKILNSLNCVDYISFGSESGDIKALKEISDILAEEPDNYRILLKENLNLGLSFPVARNKAIKEFISSDTKKSIDEILNKSNNILAIEYLKALKRLNSNIKPLTINRIGADYNDEIINEKYSSATAIRKKIILDDIDSVKDLLPKASYELMREYLLNHQNFNILNNYNDILKYLVLTSDRRDLIELFDMEEGLENRIIDKFRNNGNLNQIINNISSKRHTKTRINRILIHLLNGLKEDDVNRLYKSPAPYMRILASNKKGLEIIRKIKNNSNIPIINKFNDYKKYKSGLIDEFIKFEERATDIFFLGLKNDNPIKKMDYINSPYIKK